MEKYPLFKGFHYKPFASGLNNMRKKHNKEVADRAVHDTNGGQCKWRWWSARVLDAAFIVLLILFILTRLTYFMIDDGLKAQATATLVGNEALLDEVDEQTFAEDDEDDVYDGMPHLSLGDEDGTTRYGSTARSVCFAGSTSPNGTPIPKKKFRFPRVIQSLVPRATWQFLHHSLHTTHAIAHHTFHTTHRTPHTVSSLTSRVSLTHAHKLLITCVCASPLA
jgi:hypothetical protein